MNVNNLNKLIDHLETEVDIGFNMAKFSQNGGLVLDHSGHDCGTVACLAGHIYLINHPEDYWKLHRGKSIHQEVFRHEGATFLGLPQPKADELFLCVLPPPIDGIDQSRWITLSQAIRCLEILRDTGEVNWKEALQ